MKEYVKNTGLARSFELSPNGQVARSSAVSGRGLVQAHDSERFGLSWYRKKWQRMKEV